MKVWEENFDVLSPSGTLDSIAKNVAFGEIAQLYDVYEDALESICRLHASEIPFSSAKMETIAETILQKIYHDPTVEGKDFIAVKFNWI